ncbi:MAG: hypothetical protein HGA96_09665 [Desulfobulbaceae bacterium]|nr:hypothetical protein [Desulfobulbaceae bacterium]
MKRILIAAFILVSLVSACAVVPAGRPGELMVVPLLPPLVLLDAEPFYFHGGFYYHYSNDAWSYSRSKGGPWNDLPRDHYPKEVRYLGNEGRGERDHDRDHRRR